VLVPDFTLGIVKARTGGMGYPIGIKIPDPCRLHVGLNFRAALNGVGSISNADIVGVGFAPIPNPIRRDANPHKGEGH
jgi:hypothetical protein